MFPSYLTSDFEVVRNPSRCTNCRICEKQCANGVHSYDSSAKVMISDETKCVDCLRCVTYCPTKALKIVKNDCCFRENENWKSETIKEIYKQADSGGVLLSSISAARTAKGMPNRESSSLLRGDPEAKISCIIVFPFRKN